MGTNFYYQEPISLNSFIYLHPVHIGKSSCGWMFGLRTDKELNLLTWNDWKAFLKDKTIVDEYDNEWTFEDFCQKVENRPKDWKRHSRIGYCLSWGEGTWDMMDDIEFS